MSDPSHPQVHRLRTTGPNRRGLAIITVIGTAGLFMMTRQELADALAKKLGDPAFADRVTSSWGTFLKPAAGRVFKRRPTVALTPLLPGNVTVAVTSKLAATPSASMSNAPACDSAVRPRW